MFSDTWSSLIFFNAPILICWQVGLTLILCCCCRIVKDPSAVGRNNITATRKEEGGRTIQQRQIGKTHGRFGFGAVEREWQRIVEEGEGDVTFSDGCNESICWRQERRERERPLSAWLGRGEEMNGGAWWFVGLSCVNGGRPGDEEDVGGWCGSVCGGKVWGEEEK